MKSLFKEYYELQDFVPLKKAFKHFRDQEKSCLEQYYTSSKNEMSYKPVEAFVYPLSVKRNLSPKNDKKENQKLKKFEIFLDTQKQRRSLDLGRKIRKNSLGKI
jgi:hypothetical protein